MWWFNSFEAWDYLRGSMSREKKMHSIYGKVLYSRTQKSLYCGTIYVIAMRIESLL